MSEFDFRIRYWGTTGTFARPPRPAELLDKLSAAIEELHRQDALSSLAMLDADTRRKRLAELLPFWMRAGYSGNTTCVEIDTPDGLIILDAGSGFRELGIELERRWNDPEWQGSRVAHVLLTHAHMDHTIATPLFDPYYDPKNHFHIWGPATAIDSLNFVLSPQSPLRTVYFPVTFDEMRAQNEFNTIEAGEELAIGATRVSTMALNHPGGCLAYRLRRGDRTVVFATDHEHSAVPDQRLVDFARGADLLYTDAQYLAEEYDGREGIGGGPGISRDGWGHSTIDAAVATAITAQVRHLHLGHHEPKRSDQQLAEIEQLAKRISRALLKKLALPEDLCQTRLAYEGLEIEL